MSTVPQNRSHQPTWRRLFLAQGLAGILLLPLAATAGEPGCATDGLTELVLFHEPACPWCERWEQEIGGAYPRTSEGCSAPLRRVDMSRARPPDLATLEGIRFSPTFVLVSRGEEVGRIVGYPGEHFFWPLLGDLLAELGPPERR